MKEYFSHDYGAREDEKIKRLLYAHGWAGYGLYWAVVEMLYINDGYMLTEYERIAFDLRTEAGIIESIICDFDLFKFKKNKFYSVSALERLEQRKIKSDKARQSASVRWNKANAMRPHSDSNAIKVKESKVNKSKEKKKPVKHKYGEFKNVLLTDDEHRKLLDAFGERFVKRKVQDLSEYIEIKKPKYKNHYLVLRKWAKRDFSNEDLRGIKSKPNDMVEKLSKQWGEK